MKKKPKRKIRETPDVFDKLDAKDGVHVPLVVSEEAVDATLLLKIFQEGEPALEEPVQLAYIAEPAPAALGELIRLHLVLDAVARYFTTGGSWRELDAALKVLEHHVPGGIALDGYHLLESYPCVEPGTDVIYYQHVFVKDGTDQAVLWEEPRYNESGGLYGGFIERKTLAQIQQEKDDDAGSRPDGALPEGHPLPILD